MAKKKSARRRGFNLSQEVRDLLSENPNLTGKEVLAAMKEKYPRKRINEGSLGVAFSVARRKLGISKKRTTVRRRKPAASRRAGRGAANGTVDMSALQAARKFVAEVGDADTAVAAIKQLQTLQIG